MNYSRSISEDELLENLGWIQVLARTLVRDGSTADDVTQDTWLRAMERPPRAREGAGLRAWLAKVTRSRARSSARSARRRARYEAAHARAEALPSTLEVVERAATQRVVVEELMRLEEPDRSTVLQRYLDGMTASEIARARGESPAAVRKRLSRAIEKLRARLEPRFGGREALLSSLVAFGRPENLLPLGTTKLLLVAGLAVSVTAAGAWIASRPASTLAEGAGGAELAAAAPIEPAQDEAATQEEKPAAARTPVPVETLPTGTLSLAGQVFELPGPGLREERAAAAGVTVQLAIREPGPSPEFLERELETDPEGCFRFVVAPADLPAGEGLLVFVSVGADDDYRRAGRTLRLVEEEPLPEHILLERAPHGVATGRVVDTAGTPLAGVRIVPGSSYGLGGLGVDTVPPETTSDEDGRFSLGKVRGSVRISASKPGWRQLQQIEAVREQAGGWRPLRIVMAAAGAIAFEARAPSGAPLSGLKLTASVSPDEPVARGRSPVHATVETDAEGHGLLEDVWTGVKLRLAVETDTGSWETERARDGVLCGPGDEAGAGAIVVPPAGVLELEVRPPAPLVLRGRVVDVEGAPVPRASVFLLLPRTHEGDARFARRVETERQLAADDEGRFTLELGFPATLTELSLLATNGRRDLPTYAEASVADYTAVARRDVSAAELRAEAPEIELVLEPTLSITGVVRRADGTPATGRIGFRRVDGGQRTRLDTANTRLQEDGSFEIVGLLPGLHDLDVRLTEDFFFTWSRLPRRFAGIEAGTRGLELVVGEPEAVNVTITATLDGEPVKFAGLLGMHQPYERRPIAGAVPQPELTVRRLDGWPASATLSMGYGQSGDRSSLGTERYMYLGSSEEPFTFEPVAAGWYRIGVRGWSETGAALHPGGTGLVFLEPGEYRIHFELRRAGELRGRVTNGSGGKIDPDLRVGLVDARGRPVHTRRSPDFMGPTSPLGADGGFWLQDAPAGTFTLLIGTEQALLAGRGVHREEVEIRPGDAHELTVELR